MTTKCTGLMGHIFGHKWRNHVQHICTRNGGFYCEVFKCQRCGAVTGEKK